MNQEKALKERLSAQLREQNNHINLEDMGLEAIPEEVLAMAHVTSINLRNNALTALPDDWGALRRLMSLDVSDNFLSSIPSSIGQLKQLQTIEMTNNRLNHVDEALAQLTNLEFIDLSNNQLNTLPQAIWLMEGLRHINVGFNQFTEPPTQLGRNLNVSMDFNAITHIDHLPATIDVSNNPYQQIVENISTLLSQHMGQTRFCVTGFRADAIDSIKIDGIGDVLFPMTSDDQHALVARAARAPFGKGTQTLLDITVRRTWQISPEAVHIDTPGWKDTLDGIVREASAGLGIEGHTRASLYKMLVYEPGDFFVPHQDTEKEDGMFATLVVVLPSPFEGGELVVHHEGQSVCLPHGHLPQRGLSYAAFYTDCTHELQAVTQGCRIVLVYNLCHGLDTRRRPNTSAGVINHLRDRLVSWSKDERPHIVNRMILPLTHQYTRAALSFAHLKGRDWHMGHALKEATKSTECELFLTMVSIETHGHVTTGSSEVEQLTPRYYEDQAIFRLHHWIDKRDNHLDQTIDVTNFHEMPLSILDTLHPTHLSHHYTGNEGTEYARFYETCALVLTRQDNKQTHQDHNIYHDEYMGQVNAKSLAQINQRIEHCRRTSAFELDLSDLMTPQLYTTFPPHDGVERLNLGELELYLAPPWLSTLPNLKHLSLRNANMCSFIKHLKHLSSLEVLDLSMSTVYNNAQWAEIFTHLAGLPNLHTVHLNGIHDIHCILEDMTDSLISMHNVKTLTLRDNYIERLPEEILTMANLQTLDLRQSQVTRWDEDKIPSMLNVLAPQVNEAYHSYDTSSYDYASFNSEHDDDIPF